MPDTDNVFHGCLPALMTPCWADRTPDYDALVRTARRLVEAGMRVVVYCGPMGDWPLLSDALRQEGVRRLVAAGVPEVVGTGAQSSRAAAGHVAHAPPSTSPAATSTCRYTFRNPAVAGAELWWSRIR